MSFDHSQCIPALHPFAGESERVLRDVMAGPESLSCVVRGVRRCGASGLMPVERLAKRGPLAPLPVTPLTGQGSVPMAGRANKLIADMRAISVRAEEVHRIRVVERMKVSSVVARAKLLREPGGG